MKNGIEQLGYAIGFTLGPAATLLVEALATFLAVAVLGFATAVVVDLVDRGRSAALRRPYVAGLIHGCAVMLVLAVSCTGCMRELAQLEVGGSSSEDTGGDTGDDAAGMSSTSSSTTHQGGSGEAGTDSEAEGGETANVGESGSTSPDGTTTAAESGEGTDSAATSSGSDGGESTGGYPEPGEWSSCYADGGAYVCPGDALCLHDGGGQASPNLCVPSCIVNEGACATPWGDGVCWDTGPVGGSGHCLVPCTMDGCPDWLQCVAWGPQQVLVCVGPAGE